MYGPRYRRCNWLDVATQLEGANALLKVIPILYAVAAIEAGPAYTKMNKFRTVSNCQGDMTLKEKKNIKPRKLQNNLVSQ